MSINVELIDLTAIYHYDIIKLTGGYLWKMSICLWQQKL